MIRKEPTRTRAVISAFQASAAHEPRVSLLEVMGQSSSQEALPILRSSLNDSNPEIARAAILGLTSWETPDPLIDLLNVARSAPDQPQGILALRGYLKLLALPSQRPAAESGRMLADAMRLASEPAEKRAILAMLSAYPSAESLRVAELSLGDQSVAAEAKIALNRLKVAIALTEK
jgi:HEAT repeat protein